MKTKKRLAKSLSVLLALVLVFGISASPEPFFDSLFARFFTSSSAATLRINLISDGTFEKYNDGTNLLNAPGDCEWFIEGTDSWKSVRVSSNRAQNGLKSLKLHTMYSYAFRKISGLEANTNYIFTYNYRLPAYASDNNATLLRVGIIGDSGSVPASGDSDVSNVLDSDGYISINGTGNWEQASVKFNTGSFTSAYIAIKYNSTPSAFGGNEDETDLFLDNLALYNLSAMFSDSNTNNIYSKSDCNYFEDGGFESYSAGTDMVSSVYDENRWYLPGSSDWRTVKVSSDRAASGNNSLCINARHNTAYRMMSGLNTNTSYTLSFKYWLPYYADNSAYLNNLTVVSANDAVDTLANYAGPYLNKVTYGAGNGTCDGTNWKTASITFNTGDNTSVWLCINFTANVWSDYLYIDDLEMYRNVFAAPIIVNGDFENGNTNGWSKNFDTWSKLETDSSSRMSGTYCARLTNTTPKGRPNAQPFLSEAVYVRKGHAYTFTITVDRREYNGCIDYYGRDHGQVGISVTKGPKANNAPLVTEVVFNKDDTESQIYDTKSVSYTPDFTGEVYFKVNVYHGGVVYIDNFKVTEADNSSYKKLRAFDSLGTAIRLETEETAQGIRCKTQVDKQILTGNNCYGVYPLEYGTVVMRSDFLGSSELKKDKKYTYNSKIYKPAVGVAYSSVDNTMRTFRETPTTLEYTGVLTGINPNRYTADFTVRAYMTYVDSNGNVDTVYYDPYDLSVYSVAKMAYNAKNADGSFAESESARSHFYNEILSKKSEYSVTINDKDAPITTNYQGISSTIYHCFTYMEDKTWNRKYTDAQASLEFDRLRDSGIKTVRSAFFSRFCWNNGKWDWDKSTNKDMAAVYKWAKELQNRGINIALNPGYSLPLFDTCVDSYSHNSLSEVEYLYGYGNDLYGENSGVTLTGTAKEQQQTKAANRYGEWVVQTLNAFKAEGINNVKYLVPFIEPNPQHTDLYIKFVGALNNKLNAKNLRKSVQIVGPNQSLYPPYDDNTLMINKLYNSSSFDPDWIDIYSSHRYTNSNMQSIYNETIYSNMADESFDYFVSSLRKHSTTKSFWSDEFYGSSTLDGHLFKNSGMQFTQVAAGIVSAMNHGVDRICTWQLLDQLWIDNSGTNSSGEKFNVFSPLDPSKPQGNEFFCGVHITGTAPALPVTAAHKQDYYSNNIRSYTPRTSYYGMGLLGRELGYENGRVLKTTNNSSGGLYTGTVYRNDGKMVIVAVNTKQTELNISYNISSNLTSVAARSLYDPESIVPDRNATQITSDCRINIKNGKFYDTVPAGSFAVYVIDANQNPDVDIDVGDIL